MGSYKHFLGALCHLGRLAYAKVADGVALSSIGVLLGCLMVPGSDIRAQWLESPPEIQAKSQLLDLLLRQEAAVRCVSGSSYGMKARFDGETRVNHEESVLAFVQETDPLGRSLLDYSFQEASADGGRVFQATPIYGYDGRVSWLLERSSKLVGVQEDALPMRSAQIQYERGAVHAEALTGLRFTLLGFYEQRKARFSEVLSRSEVPFDLVSGPEVGFVTLTCKSKGGFSESWVLRRSWFYALAEYRKLSPSGDLLREIRVHDAVRVADCFWYPVKISSVAYPRVGQRLESHIDIDDVKVVRSVLDSTFSPLFPHGTIVTDLASGSKVTVAAPDGELEKSLSSQAERMRQLVLFEPGEPGPSLVQRGVAILSVILASLLALFVWRRRSPGGGVPGAVTRKTLRRSELSASLWIGFVAVAAAEGCKAQSPLHLDQSADNCALSAVALVANFFGVSEPIEETASRLECGNRRLHAVDMGKMRSALQQLGLEVRGYRDSTIASLIEECRIRCGIAIVHVDIGRRVGHFYLLAPAASGVVVVNPGYTVGVHDWSSPFVGRLIRQATGSALVVFVDPSRRTWDLVGETEWTLSLGSVEAEERSESIPITNGGDSSLRLHTAESSCGCFVSAELVPSVIPVRGRGALRVRIRGSALGTSITSQQVRLEFAFDDGVLQGSSAGQRVQRTLAIEASRRTEQPIIRPVVMPSLVLGHRIWTSASDGVRFAAFATVVVPSGGRVSSWQSNGPVEVRQENFETIGGGIGIRFRIEWRQEEDVIMFYVQDHAGTTTPVLCRLRAPTNHENTTTTEVR